MVFLKKKNIREFLKFNNPIAGGSIALVFLWFAGPQIAVNMSASLPKGFYFITKHGADDVKRGDIILFYDENISSLAYKRGYIREGEPIGKRVAAVEGDSVIINSNKVIALGEVISEEVPLIDSKGREMEVFHYKGVVPEGSLFLIGDAKNSFDSRYYGFVKKNSITAIITPFIVW